MAAKYSWLGLKAAWRNEEAFRQEIVLFFILAPLGIWLGETGLEKSILCGVLVLVLIVELLNSGLEAIVDRVSTEHHELSGRAKDLGSAAVMLAQLNVLLTWALILYF